MSQNVSNPMKLLRVLCIVTLASAAAQAAGVSGAIFTTTVNGSAVNANQYDSKCAVYLDGGPGPHAPARSAGLPDGDYFFQVTDPSGAQLLSTDPVSNRRFHVNGGVITAFTGTGGPPHLTGIDQDHAAQGAITIGLATSACPADYLYTPNTGHIYKVWATPVASFVGSPLNVDNPCGNGCFHGFLSSQSKTDNFKAQPATAATFCLTLQKQSSSGGVLSPIPGWIFQVTDPSGVTNQHIADNTGQITVCQLVSGGYSVTEDALDPNQPPPPIAPPGCYFVPTASLNGSPSSSIPVTFNWNSAQPLTMTVSFVTALLCIG